jgi:hypothetical protein
VGIAVGVLVGLGVFVDVGVLVIVAVGTLVSVAVGPRPMNIAIAFGSLLSRAYNMPIPRITKRPIIAPVMSNNGRLPEPDFTSGAISSNLANHSRALS